MGGVSGPLTVASEAGPGPLAVLDAEPAAISITVIEVTIRRCEEAGAAGPVVVARRGSGGTNGELAVLYNHSSEPVNAREFQAFKDANRIIVVYLS
jgi:hypothetical protein